MGTSDKPKAVLSIEFDNPEAREHFAQWLCNSGEQDYWESMRYREAETPGPITAVEFEYHGPTGARTKRGRAVKTFLGDNTIRTTCGRLSEDDDDEG